MTDSRCKGKRTELELVAALRPFFPEARRNFEQVRTQSGRDIDGTPSFCFQLKSGKAPRWRVALAEATGCAGSDVPVGITREDRTEFIVHLRLSDLLSLLPKPEGRESRFLPPAIRPRTDGAR